MYVDRLAPRVEAAEAGLQRFEQRAAAFSEDLAALTQAFYDCSAKIDAQADELVTVIDVIESTCTVDDLQRDREHIEAQLDSRFDTLSSRFDEQICKIKAENKAQVDALTATVKQDTVELTAWRTRMTGQLEDQGAQCSAAGKKALECAANLETAEAHVQAELETFAKQFQAAAQRVEGNAYALDRRLHHSVSMLTQAIQEDSAKAVRYSERLAEHVKHSLEMGQQQTLRTQLDMERLIGQLGAERIDLKETLAVAAFGAKMQQSSHTDSSSALDVMLRETTSTSKANAESSVSTEKVEQSGEQLVSLLARLDTRDTRTTHAPLLATAGAVSKGTIGALGIDEGEPPGHAEKVVAAPCPPAARPPPPPDATTPSGNEVGMPDGLSKIEQMRWKRNAGAATVTATTAQRQGDGSGRATE